MTFDDGITELLSRNSYLLKDKRVIIAGHISSLQILSQIRDCSRAFIISDNFETAAGLAASIGVRIGRSSFERADRKHLSVIFGDTADERVLNSVEESDVLLLLLNKNKSMTKRDLFLLHNKLAAGGKVLIAGANAIGGKSADGIMKGAGTCRKVDYAGKCTLFVGTAENKEAIKEPTKPADVNFGGLILKQRHGLFSQGRLDKGTEMLLDALYADLTKGESVSLKDTSFKALPALSLPGPVADIGCGSGIVGLSLAACGAETVVCTDISAAALCATEENAAINGLTDRVHTLACNMLPDAATLSTTAGGIAGGKFACIVSNPPFHDSLEKTTAPAFLLAEKAKNALIAGGALYIVGNTCLHYDSMLSEFFEHVEILSRSNAFIVCKAY